MLQSDEGDGGRVGERLVNEQSASSMVVGMAKRGMYMEGRNDGPCAREYKAVRSKCVTRFVD